MDGGQMENMGDYYLFSKRHLVSDKNVQPTEEECENSKFPDEVIPQHDRERLVRDDLTKENLDILQNILDEKEEPAKDLDGEIDEKYREDD